MPISSEFNTLMLCISSCSLVSPARLVLCFHFHWSATLLIDAVIWKNGGKVAVWLGMLSWPLQPGALSYWLNQLKFSLMYIHASLTARCFSPCHPFDPLILIPLTSHPWLHPFLPDPTHHSPLTPPFSSWPTHSSTLLHPFIIDFIHNSRLILKWMTSLMSMTVSRYNITPGKFSTTTLMWLGASVDSTKASTREGIKENNCISGKAV